MALFSTDKPVVPATPDGCTPDTVWGREPLSYLNADTGEAQEGRETQ